MSENGFLLKINHHPYRFIPFEEKETNEKNEMVIIGKGVNEKLKGLAVTLWTLSGSLMSLAKASASGGTFWDEIQPLFAVFQEMALGIGALAIMAGLVLLVVKKRWGQVTLKTSIIIVVGIFLVPSALMLLAIIGTYLNDALYEALKNVRDAKNIPVGGK